MIDQVYDVDFFLEKFSKIPEKFWCIRSLKNGNQRCAQGHCAGENYDGSNFCNNELIGLITVFNSLNKSLVYINNGDDSKYQQPTPKQRILAALYDIKAKQQPKEEVKTITKYVTVVIDSKVKELTEELVNN